MNGKTREIWEGSVIIRSEIQTEKHLFPRVSGYKRRRDVKEVDNTWFRVVHLMEASQVFFLQCNLLMFLIPLLSLTHTHTYGSLFIYGKSLAPFKKMVGSRLILMSQWEVEFFRVILFVRECDYLISPAVVLS